MTPPPHTNGDYEIVGELGRGGMGVVYKARQVSLDRPVALKVISPEYSEQVEALKRHHREARLLAGLNHPNVVAVFDVGTLGDSPFLSMELIDGQTLNQMLDEDPAAVRSQADILFRQILAGVAALHERHIVHRDLKPANVMVTRDGRAMVMDLGLAREISAGSTQITEDGVLLGTPRYVAPEQFSGAPPTFASDLWGLGCMYHQLVTGTPLFKADSLIDLIKLICAGPSAPTRVRAPDVPPKVADLIDRLLDRDPQGRPADASAALTLWDAAVGPKVVRASVRLRPRAASPPRTPANRRGRGRRFAGLAALGLTAGVVGLGLRLLAPSPDYPAPVNPVPDRPSAGSGSPGATRDQLTRLREAVRRLDPSGLLDKMRRDLEARTPDKPLRVHWASLRDRWKATLDHSLQGSELKRLADDARKSGRASAGSLARALEFQSLLNPVALLRARCAFFGVSMDLDPSWLFPRDHGPTEPPRLDRAVTVGVVYPLRAQDQVPTGPVVTRIPTAELRPVLLGQRAADVDALTLVRGVESQKAHGTYVIERPLPLYPSRLDQRVVLTLVERRMGPGEAVTLSLSPDGTRWSTVALVPGEVSGDVARFHHVAVHPALVDGPRFVRLQYQAINASTASPFCIVMAVLFHYVPGGP